MGERRLVWAAGAIVAAQAAWWAWFALRGFFQLDDFFYLSVLRLEHPGLWDWVGRIYFEHFAPGHRLAFWLVGTGTPASWTLLQMALLALFIAGLIAYYKLLELLFGRSWWLLVPLVFAGFAWQWSVGFAWPSAGLHLIPAFSFAAISTYAFVRHLAGRRWQWLALAGLAYLLGLMFFIRVLLVPVGLVLIRYLFLQRSLAPRALGRALWEDRWLWLMFLAPAVIYASYYTRRQGLEAPRPPLPFVRDYLDVAWFRNVWPGFLGLRLHDAAGVRPNPMFGALGGWRAGVAVGAQIALAALIAVSFMRKGTAALRAWGYIVVVTAATFWLTARGRVGDGGPGVGYDPRYVSDLCWQIPLGITFALHPRRVLTLGEAWPPPARPQRALAACVAVATAATVAFALHSAIVLQDARGGPDGRRWVDNLRATAARLDGSGRVTVVDDGQSPPYVWNARSYADLLPLLDAPLRVGRHPEAVILPDGEVRPSASGR